MFHRIVSASLQQPWIVLSLVLLLVGAGIGVVQRQSVDVLPDLTRPTLSVHTEAAGLSPQDVETLITRHVEAALGGLPDVVRIRSVSSAALSLVYVEFEWDSDPYRNRQLVAERLDSARVLLPPGLQPRIGPLTSLMGEVMLLALQSDEPTADLRELRDLADWRLSPALLSVPGVAQVVVIGGEVRQYEVRPRPSHQQLLGIGTDEIASAIEGYGRDLGGGFVDVGGQEIKLRLSGRPLDFQALAATPIAWRGEAAIRLGQVADIVEAARTRRGDAGANGEAAVILAIQKQPDADTLALTQRLEDRLAALQRSLPAGYEAGVLFRQADFIERSIGNVREALLHAVLIVAIVLFAFLASGRATLITLMAIPLSVLAALLVLQLLGLSINTMTLGGLAIAVGELVDDAVVGIENVVRRLRRHADGSPVAPTIASATVEVRAGILYATVIVVLVFVPLFALDGIAGRLFAPLGIAYIAAILASLLVAMCVTPVLCKLAFSTPERTLPAELRWLLSLKRGYLAILKPTLQHSTSLGIIAMLLVIVAATTALSLPRAFLPAFNEGTLTLNLILNPGIALTESSRIGQLAEQRLRTIPEVRYVGRRTGRGELDEHAEGVHYSEIEVALTDEGRDRQQIVDDIRHQLADLPGQLSISQPISHRLDHLLSGVRAPLVVKIYGEDAQILRRLAEQVRSQLAALEGLTDVQIEAQADTPQLQVRFDAVAAALHGVSASRAQQTLSDLLVGRPLSLIVDDERRHELVLRLPESARTPEGLATLLVDAPAGPVPLSWIASLETTSAPNQINREDLRRRIVVSAFAAEHGFDRAGGEVQSLLAQLQPPAGYEIRLEGQIVAQQSALKRLTWLSLLSLLLMIVVLYGRYRSWPLTLIVLGNVPLALVGGVLALTISEVPLSVASVVGFVTLAGIAVRNGILKISHYLNLSLHEGLPFGESTVLRGSAERLSPVLMTAVITALALLPLLWSGDEPGKEILYPVALVIFGGLISSTLLDSFLTPALYLRFGASALKRLRALGDTDKPVL